LSGSRSGLNVGVSGISRLENVRREKAGKRGDHENGKDEACFAN
jgi:hypothetical protein